ncbi:MAG: hypothetical protein LBQ41_00385 [Candidatus Ancillula sp.]|jgi:hypothetical protein|nr:hypothetical protein [Candidatus Ancillula sp.]
MLTDRYKCIFLEFALLFSVPLVLAVCLLFSQDLFVVSIAATNLALVYFYIMTFKPQNHFVIAGCSAICLIFPLLFYYLFDTFQTDALIVPFASLIGVVLLVSFGFQIFRNDHSNTLQTVVHSVALSLVVCATLGYLLAKDILDHSAILTVIFALLIWSMLGAINLFLYGVLFLLKKKPFDDLQFLLTNSGLLFLASIGIFFLLNFLFSNLPPIAVPQFIIILIGVICVNFTNHRQFASGVYYYAATFRALFPVAISGVVVYLTCAYTGAGGF